MGSFREYHSANILNSNSLFTHCLRKTKNSDSHRSTNRWIEAVDQPGLEPGTSRLWVCCSNQLSYKSDLTILDKFATAKVMFFGKSTKHFGVFLYFNYFCNRISTDKRERRWHYLIHKYSYFTRKCRYIEYRWNLHWTQLIIIRENIARTIETHSIHIHRTVYARSEQCKCRRP